MKSVIIIGAGPSGLTCAIRLKESNPSLKITVLERLEKPAKKLLATGNGKCNFTNKFITKDGYNNDKFVKSIIENYSPEYVIEYFKSMGLISKHISEGRIYPYSESAVSFYDCLMMRFNQLDIELRNNYDVNNIQYKNEQYLVYNKNQRNYYLSADIIVFATGGKAYPVLGSNGSGYSLLKAFKINSTPVFPGLVGFKTSDQHLKILSGIRIKANVSLVDKKAGKPIFEEYGEVQFKDDGISGIVIMNASNKIVRLKTSPLMYLDLAKDYTVEDLKQILLTHQQVFKDKELTYLFTGIFQKNLGIAILRKAGFDITRYNNELSLKEIEKIASSIKKLQINYTNPYDFNKAQITIGGIDINEINPNLSLKRIPNAYIAGELMDIDGICGGYNLHWAISSGMQVAKTIIEKESLND